MLELTAHGSIVGVQQLVPAAIAHADGAFGRLHDVGEQDGFEHTVDFGFGSRSGEELLDVVENAVVALADCQMIVTRQFDVPRARDVFGEVPTVLDRQ